MKRIIFFSLFLALLFSCCSLLPVRGELETWICISYNEIIQAREQLKEGGDESLMLSIIDTETDNFSYYMAEYKRRYGRFYLPEKECRQ